MGLIWLRGKSIFAEKAKMLHRMQCDAGGEDVNEKI